MICRSEIILLIVSLTSVLLPLNGQSCQPFQLYENPVVMQGAQKCSAFANSACCGFGIATRAYNWAKEDDGCGVVSGDCLQLLTDLACHVNCAPNMQAQVVNNILRPVVCTEWVRRIYEACLPYQWCTTTQEETSTCAFLQTKSTTSRQGRYTHTTTSTTMQNAWDTCTWIDDITMSEFARKILEVEPSSPNCTFPLDQPRVLSTNGAHTLSVTFQVLIPLVVAVLLI